MLFHLPSVKFLLQNIHEGQVDQDAGGKGIENPFDHGGVPAPCVINLGDADAYLR